MSKQKSSNEEPIKPVQPTRNPGTPVKRGLDAPKPSIKPVKPSPKPGTTYRLQDRQK